MKISYRTHPALQIIKNGNLNSMLIDAIDLPHFKTKGEAINRHFKFWAPIFSEEITFITAPFVSALEKHWTKFKSLYRDILENNVTALTVKGTFIFKGIVHALHFNLPAGKNPEVVLFVFGKDGSLIAYSIDNFSGQGKLECWLCKRFVSNEDDNEYINEDYKSFVINNRTVIQLVVLNIFKKYAEVETKELKPNSKTLGINCKYVNDTDLKITYLDSKWFTTLVKSDAFNVRGHFRLQPFGEGLKEHKLIWISEFTKSGYTAPARKLSLTNSQLL